MNRGLRRGRTPRRERGANAVEFAIILPVLISILFGIIDYGLLFFDSNGLKQGSREAARQGVVLNANPASPCSATSPITYANIACTARVASDNTIGNTAGSVTGGGPSQIKVYMRVVQAPNVAAAGWEAGNQLWVCTQVAERSITGLTPFPANGIIKSKTVMSIEKKTPTPTGSLVQDTAPTGGDWSWCA